MKTGVLLVNLGTPDDPSTPSVRRYLREFLNDPRVIDIPFLKRLLLVNLIIVPFRAPKSAKLYRQIWTKEGSPLLIHGKEVKSKLQETLGKEYIRHLAMRYQNPSIPAVLEKFRKENVNKLIVIPLYPQYASSSTGSTIEKVMKHLSEWQTIPELHIASPFYQNQGFIDTIVDIAKKYTLNDYDYFLFSFHGLPERQIKKGDVSGHCLQSSNCCDQITSKNHLCYRANCFATARQIAKELQIPTDKYTVCFQSRLGSDPWLKPYSDFVLEEKAKEGKKRLLVFSPAFVADCLETIHEIGVEYDELFREHGGEKVQLVESLNSHPLWIETLKKWLSMLNNKGFTKQ